MKEQDSLRKRWRWPGEGGYTADSETNGLKLHVKGQLSGTTDWLNTEGRNQQEFLAVSLSNDLYAAPFTEMEVEEEEFSGDGGLNVLSLGLGLDIQAKTSSRKLNIQIQSLS